MPLESRLKRNVPPRSRKPLRSTAPAPAPLSPIPSELPGDVRQFLTEARSGDAELESLAARWKTATPEQRRDALRAWHEQHAGWLAAQKARAATIAKRIEAQIAEQPFITLIPSDASPQWKETLTLQADLDDSLAAATDALKDASPERIRDAAREWHDRHRAALDRLTRMRESLLSTLPQN